MDRVTYCNIFMMSKITKPDKNDTILLILLISRLNNLYSDMEHLSAKQTLHIGGASHHKNSVNAPIISNTDIAEGPITIFTQFVGVSAEIILKLIVQFYS